MKRFTIAAAISAFALAGCGGGGIFDLSCDDQRDDLVHDLGQPEEIRKYDSDGYHSWTYWYWKKGFSRTFTWGSSVDECRISDYRFTPIS